MKTKDIIQKTDRELTLLISSSRTDIAKAYVDLRTTQVANVKQIAGLKKQLARAMTIARQREIAAALSATETPMTNATKPKTAHKTAAKSEKKS